MVSVVFEGHACSDCAIIIANDDWSGVADANTHSTNIAREALWKLGAVVVDPDDFDEFSTRRCDNCGDTHDGGRFGIAVLA